MSVILRVSLGIAVAALCAGLLVAETVQAVNTKCPIKGTPANPSIVGDYKGKKIAFCCNNCLGAFKNDPDGIAARVPELKAPEPKTPAKPANTTPCEVKKTIKGYYCVMCDRELGVDDIRGGECKKCETKPEQVDVCVKRVAWFYSKCQHKKKEPKPFICCNKQWAVPTFEESLARCTYACEVCGVKAVVESGIKHKADCKPKFGDGVVKVCTKSGKEPHVGDDK